MCQDCRNLLTKHSNKQFNQKEWSKINYDITTKYINDNHDHCLCGHYIQDKYPITDNVIYAILGSNCIKNIFPENKKLQKAVFYVDCDICDCTLKKTSYIAHLKTKKHKEKVADIKRQKRVKCKRCKKSGDVPTGWKLCKSCNNIVLKEIEPLRKKYNRCGECKKYKIPKKKSYKICFDCHMKHKHQREKEERERKRQHKIFMEYMISSDDDEYF